MKADSPLTPDDPRLTAFALGELEGAEQEEVATAVAADARLQQAVEQLRAEVATVRAQLLGATAEQAAQSTRVEAQILVRLEQEATASAGAAPHPQPERLLPTGGAAIAAVPRAKDVDWKRVIGRGARRPVVWWSPYALPLAACFVAIASVALFWWNGFTAEGGAPMEEAQAGESMLFAADSVLEETFAKASTAAELTDRQDLFASRVWAYRRSGRPVSVFTPPNAEERARLAQAETLPPHTTLVAAAPLSSGQAKPFAAQAHRGAPSLASATPTAASMEADASGNTAFDIRAILPAFTGQRPLASETQTAAAADVEAAGTGEAQTVAKPVATRDAKNAEMIHARAGTMDAPSVHPLQSTRPLSAVDRTTRGRPVATERLLAEAEALVRPVKSDAIKNPTEAYTGTQSMGVASSPTATTVQASALNEADPHGAPVQTQGAQDAGGVLTAMQIVASGSESVAATQTPVEAAGAPASAAPSASASYAEGMGDADADQVDNALALGTPLSPEQAAVLAAARHFRQASLVELEAAAFATSGSAWHGVAGSEAVSAPKLAPVAAVAPAAVPAQAAPLAPLAIRRLDLANRYVQMKLWVEAGQLPPSATVDVDAIVRGAAQVYASGTLRRLRSRSLPVVEGEITAEELGQLESQSPLLQSVRTYALLLKQGPPDAAAQLDALIARVAERSKVVGSRSARDFLKLLRATRALL